MKKLVIVLLMTRFSYADSYTKISEYAKSLEKYLMIETAHLEDIIPSISVKKPSAFQRWQMEKSGAEATYNDITNTIILKDDYFTGNGPNYRVKGVNDLADTEKYKYFLFASTTFHELSHADFDVTIENSSKSIKTLLEKKIKPWFAQKFPKFNSKIATHELFGYTAGDGIFQLYQKISDVMMNHGIKYPSMECFSKGALEKIAIRLDLTSNLEFKMTTQNIEYFSIIIPDYVYVKGVDINLKSAGFPEIYKRELYDYFVETYHFPVDQEELIKNLNANEMFSQTLEKCYEGIVN